MASKEHECENWEGKVDGVIKLASHLPGRDLPWIGFRLKVVRSTMQPMSITINMELIIVSELVEWVVLKIMRLNLLVFSGLWLVFKS